MAIYGEEVCMTCGTVIERAEELPFVAKKHPEHLTVRQQYAMAAMQALVANSLDLRLIAKQAFDMADAMIDFEKSAAARGGD